MIILLIQGKGQVLNSIKTRGDLDIISILVK